MDLLKETRFEECKPATTPLDYTVKLSREKGEPLKDHLSYRKLVGRLLYLANTRLDISHAVGKLSQFLDCPTTQHMQEAHHVLRYLKGAPTAGLFFTSEVNYNLIGFSDSDWAACPDTRKSISAYCFYLGNSLISWKSKRQLTMASSSSETEYRALASATREA
ncbi:secreted RxLR effector protein 161-like [Arachis hypogaea]|uniref:secreted RxLR effector protein 161-like n=1 Tax=Arachis hypogaea TaxID=3818 RepID=UPI003B2123E0